MYLPIVSKLKTMGVISQIRKRLWYDICTVIQCLLSGIWKKNNHSNEEQHLDMDIVHVCIQYSNLQNIAKYWFHVPTMTKFHIFARFISLTLYIRCMKVKLIVHTRTIGTWFLNNRNFKLFLTNTNVTSRSLNTS
jgi:hypothetical protein